MDVDPDHAKYRGSKRQTGWETHKMPQVRRKSVDEGLKFKHGGSGLIGDQFCKYALLGSSTSTNIK